MGQKVNPISNRLGIIRGWDSNWFGGKNFGDNLVGQADSHLPEEASRESPGFTHHHRAYSQTRHHHYLHCPSRYRHR